MVVGSDHASLPARRLAERLRDLREQEFRPLTQRVLGKALGGSDPLSIATVSLWENPSSERLPPPRMPEGIRSAVLQQLVVLRFLLKPLTYCGTMN